MPEAEDARDSGVIEDTADIMFGLFRPGEAENLPFDGKTNLKILKNRIGRTGVIIPFLFSMASHVIVEKASPNARLVEDENRLILTGANYEEILATRRHHARPAAQLKLVSDSDLALGRTS